MAARRTGVRNVAAALFVSMGAGSKIVKNAGAALCVSTAAGSNIVKNAGAAPFVCMDTEGTSVANVTPAFAQLTDAPCTAIGLRAQGVSWGICEHNIQTSPRR